MEVLGAIAGIASVSEILVKVSKHLIRLKSEIFEARNEVERLSRATKRLRSVVNEVEALSISDNDNNLWLQSSLVDYWTEHSESLQKDLLGFISKLDGLRNDFDKQSKTKNLRARFKKVFSGREIEHYESVLRDHQQSFSFMLIALAEKRQRGFATQLQKQTKYFMMIAASFGALHRTQTTLLSQQSQHLRLDDQIQNAVVQKFKMLPSINEEENQTKSFIQPALQDPSFLSLSNLEFDAVSEYYVSNKQPKISGIASDRTLSMHGVYCRVFNYKIPLGTLTAKKVTKTSIRRGNKHKKSSWHIEIVLHPVKLLRSILTRATIEWGSSVPIKCMLKTHAFNSSPDLKKHLTTGNVSAILQMFTQGYAHPTDLIAPSGNTLLHEAVVKHALGVPHMLYLCERLLEASVDPNMMNLRKTTPLTQCCQIMRRGLGRSQRMLPMTTLLIENDADLSFRDEKGESACTLLFQSGSGLQYFERTLYRMIRLEVYESFQSKDLWLMATIARTVPEFRQRLEAGLRDRRTPTQLSSCIRPRYEKILELDAARQTQWIGQAPVEDRVSFMKALCSYGTPNMLQPFIQSSIDLDETDKNGIIYTRLAARMGNLQVLMALSQAGGSLEQKDWFWNPDNLCCSALEELLFRWICMQTGRGVPGKEESSVDSELWILPWLLDQRGHESPNALYAIMSENGDTLLDILHRLLAHGYGRRDGQPPKTYLLEYRGSEVIEAVRTRNRCLNALLDAGLALECEDRPGFTAILYAIDMGEIEALNLLIRAGANLKRRCTYGITALELATSNLKAGHPRRRNRAMTDNYWDTADELLSFETDAEVYQILTQALQKDCNVKLPLLLYKYHSGQLRSIWWERPVQISILLVTAIAAFIGGALFQSQMS